MEDVIESIKKVEEEIQSTKTALEVAEQAGDEKKVDRLDKELAALRKKEAQLRQEKADLRQEKLLLLGKRSRDEEEERELALPAKKAKAGGGTSRRAATGALDAAAQELTERSSGDAVEHSEPQQAGERQRGGRGGDGAEQTQPDFGRVADQKFALPKVRLVTDVSEAVPLELRLFFCVPGPWLQQITTEKLHVLARAYYKVKNKAAWKAGGPSQKDLVARAQDLVPVLEQAIKAQLEEGGWRPPAPYHITGTSDSNHVPSELRFVERDEVIKDLLKNWFEGLRETGRKRQVGCLSHESGMGKTMLLMIMANPPMYLVDAFVDAVEELQDLESLWSFLCAQLLHVPIDLMSAKHHSVGEAVAERVEVKAKGSIPGFRRAPEGSTFDLETSIDKVLECTGRPLLLALDEVQVVEAPKFAAYREPPPANVTIDPPLEPYWATRCLLECLPLTSGGYVFIGLAGRSLGLAMVGRGVLPSFSSRVATKVKVLTALSEASIDMIISQTCLERSNKTIAAQLGLDKVVSPERYQCFCKKIYHLTGGVPLLIRRALDGCVRSGAEWGAMSTESFDLLLHPRFLAEPGACPGVVENSSIFTPTAKKCFDALSYRIMEEYPERLPADLTPKGAIAAFIMAIPAARDMWGGGDHEDLLLHAVLRIPVPYPDSTSGDEDVRRAAVMRSAAILTCSAQYTRVKEGLMLFVPGVILANKLNISLLSNVKAELQACMMTPSYKLCEWRILESLFIDIVQIRLLEQLRHREAGTSDTPDTVSLKAIVPFLTGDEADARLRCLHGGQLTRKVPGFSPQCKKSSDKAAWAAAIEDKLAKDPWAGYIHITNFGTCLERTSLFPRNVVGQPRRGSAGPDILVLGDTVWLLTSAKWRPLTMLSEADVAKDVKYVEKMYESVTAENLRPKRVVLVMFTYQGKTAKVQRWADSTTPLTTGTVLTGVKQKATESDSTPLPTTELEGEKFQVKVPPYLAVYVTNDQKLEDFLLGRELLDLLSRVLKREVLAANEVFDSNITKLVSILWSKNKGVTSVAPIQPTKLPASQRGQPAKPMSKRRKSAPAAATL